MLLFLHGFLGQKEDWDPLISHLDLPVKALDLPGHGKAPFTPDIALAVKQQVPSARCLVGYSAGGRVALELFHRFPGNYERLVLISAHPGLKEEERPARREIDAAWLECLQNEPYHTFLEKWYDQPLFTSLKSCLAFSSTLERRQTQNPHMLAQFFQHYSVANREALEVPTGALLLCGEQDLKYEKLYRTLGPENNRTVPNAGHAAHIENPAFCAKVIYEYYRNSVSCLA
jgi:2-succinyl-6-hydroxy-2,4-cyclohexadiene-1-carboxylate synthase